MQYHFRGIEIIVMVTPSSSIPSEFVTWYDVRSFLFLDIKRNRLCVPIPRVYREGKQVGENRIAIEHREESRELDERKKTRWIENE